MKRLALVAIVLLVSGCEAQREPVDGVNGIACTEIFVFGVNVTVEDEAGEPVAGAVLTLTEGDFTETMEEVSAGSYAGAGERAGTYTLTVEADGFETATVENIVAEEDECHVIPQNREVTLIAA